LEINKLITCKHGCVLDKGASSIGSCLGEKSINIWLRPGGAVFIT